MPKASLGQINIEQINNILITFKKVMDANKTDLIQSFARRGRIRFKKHALIRIVERNIKIQEIEDALLASSLIEAYPEDKPLESYLFLGVTKKNRPLHIVVALDEELQYIWIITAYDPDRDKWDETLKKRRL